MSDRKERCMKSDIGKGGNEKKMLCLCTCLCGARGWRSKPIVQVPLGSNDWIDHPSPTDDASRPGVCC